jgi:hypothetical protein
MGRDKLRAHMLPASDPPTPTPTYTHEARVWHRIVFDTEWEVTTPAGTLINK